MEKVSNSHIVVAEGGIANICKSGRYHFGLLWEDGSLEDVVAAKLNGVCVCCKVWNSRGATN